MVTDPVAEHCRLSAKRICVLFAAAGLSAQVSAWTGQLTPSLSFSETLTDNPDLSANSKGHEWITDVQPRLQFNAASARAKWDIDYQRHELVYGRERSRNNAQNLLNASATMEAVEKWMYLDVRGDVAQQAISAFGTQAPSNANVSDNRTETATYRLSPYVRGHLGGSADYLLRYNWSSTRSRSSTLADARTGEWVGNLNGQTSMAALAWGIDAGHQRTVFGDGRETIAEHVRGSLTYKLDPQLRVSLRDGREANDYMSVNKRGNNIRGVAVDWTPSETTKLAAMKEKRFFGDGHTFSLTHRTPLSAWDYSDSKDATVLPTQLGNGTLGNIYDLMYSLTAPKFPDPLLRGQFVRDYLQALGIPLNAPVIGGFLTSASYVERSQRASFALIGARNTVTLAATRSDRQELSNVSDLLGDFANSRDVLQRGVSADWAHRLSPQTALTLTAGANHSSGSGGLSQDARQRMLAVRLATQFGPRTNFGLDARHTHFVSSASSGYVETALTGAISIQF